MRSPKSQELPERKLFGQLSQQPGIVGVKLARADRSLSPPDSQYERRECHQPQASSANNTSGSGSELRYFTKIPDDNEPVVINENYPSEDNSHCCSQLSPAQGIKLQQRLREMFTAWSETVEYSKLPEDRLSPQKRFRTSQCESGLPRAKEEDGSEDDFVLVSHPVGGRGFFHLACPFYIHAPDKHQLCLLQHDFSSIESLIKHLMRHHSKPLYCSRCRKTFETLIDRDDHVLEDTCETTVQGSLEGLTEAQKARIVKNDQYHLGEIKRWGRIWSRVFPDVEKPRSPYLYQGDGLYVSMARDFWAVSGRRSVSEFLETPKDHDDKKCTSHNMALKAFLDWVIGERKIQPSYPFKDGPRN